MCTALVTLVVYLLSVMQGIGTLMHTVTGVDYNLCIFLALITFTVLTITSGSKGVLITDTIMFGIFTTATLCGVFVIAGKGGGWYNIVDIVTKADSDLLSWHGNLTYLYPTGFENIVWGLAYGVVWMSVCMVSPWQSSRYLMAKN
jgi:sodium/pantothenate symporter